MADVKWIKIYTDMFDNKKIDFISSLPEADAILVIWLRLLTLAGKSNAGGFIYLTENIPYTDDMLAYQFRKPISIIKLALETLRRLNMITLDDGQVYIKNWEEYQNIDGMERIKEQNRIRKQLERERKKALPSSNECHVTVTVESQPIHATDIDIDIELDKDKEKILKPKHKTKKPDPIPKLEYAEDVFLSEIEYSKLCDEYGEDLTKKAITILSNYKGANGKKYKSDYKAMLGWPIEKAKSSTSISKPSGNYSNNFKTGQAKPSKPTIAMIKPDQQQATADEIEEIKRKAKQLDIMFHNPTVREG